MINAKATISYYGTTASVSTFNKKGEMLSFAPMTERPFALMVPAKGKWSAVCSGCGNQRYQKPTVLKQFGIMMMATRLF